MMFSSTTRQQLLLQLLCLLPILSESSPSARRAAFFRPRPVLDLRGGSTMTEDAVAEEGSPIPKVNPALQKYSMEQLLLLQARSTRLRQALVERGLLQDYSRLDAPAVAQPVDWDCALSTEEYPKSCLYTFDAEHNTKVVAPANTTEWIGLSQLNRLRRTDPSKVEPLWHGKYAIFKSWFQNNSPYSLYASLPWQGYLLAVLLDVPLVLNAVVLAAIVTVLHITRPVWESMLTILLASGFLWQRWASWARFVHAALPLKLLLGQLAWNALMTVFGKVKQFVREYLIQWECRIWEDAIPLTILEGSMLDEFNSAGEEDYEDDVIAGMADDDDDEEEDEDEDEIDIDEE